MKFQIIGFTVLATCLGASSFSTVGKYGTVNIRSRVTGASLRSPLSIKMSDGAAVSMPVVPAAKTSKAWDMYIKTTDVLTTLFPLWTVLFAGLALVRPESFAWFTTKYFTGTLGALMLSMGITLTPNDFTRVGKQPGAVLVGFALCYILCPALGFILGKAFNLPVDLIAGLVLVGSINGGQASNLCTYIAKGDVALSVLMTTVTTIAGIFMTPLLCKMILGAVVPVDAVGIAVSCMQVVLAPIVVGMAANKYLPKVVDKVLPATPVIGVVSTCLLVASAVSQCSTSIVSAGLNLQLPVMLLHLISGLVGYFLPKALKFNETQCRTMAIETAMKSSAFGFLLAKLHFKQYGARVPSAASVVWMALVGATLAVIWRFIPVTDGSGSAEKV
jgi:bile acid:Na+ symporter, BASS family